MFFSNNRKSSLSGIQVEAAVGYEGVMGAQIAMYEGVQNDYKLFTGALMGDFKEACMVHEGESEYSIMAFQDGVMSDMWNKLKELFKKLWAKIKGIFEGFMAKFNSVFMKSSKDFATKYKAQIVSKNLSKMKANYSKPKDNFDNIVSLTGKPVEVTGAAKSGSTIEKDLEDFESDEVTLDAIKTLTGFSDLNDLKTFAKDFHEKCFDDEEEKEGFDDIKINLIGLLTSADKTESDLKKAKGNLEKCINEIIKQIEKAQTANAKDYPTEAGKDDEESSVRHTWKRNNNNAGADIEEDSQKNSYARKNVASMLNLAQRRASCTQTAINKVTAAVLAEHKFRVSQAKRIIAKAVAYNDKAKNESTMLDAIEEVAFYEAMEDLK